MASPLPAALVDQPASREAESLPMRLVHGAAFGAATALLATLSGGQRRGGILARLVEGALRGAGSAISSSQIGGSPPQEAGDRRRPLRRDGYSAPGPQAPRPSASVQRPARRAGPSRGEGIAAAPASPDVLRKLYLGASALSFSVVADSSLEHYRGGFYNPAMYIGPTVSALMLAATARDAAGPRPSRARRALYGAAGVTGLIGTGFHLYNVSKREGGWRLVNVFYGAPVAAPMGITFAGLFGLAASSLARGARRGRTPRLLGRSAGKVLGAVAAAGLLGTSAEAGMLHFRGAFQDPFMYIPVTVPPLAALALGAAALRRSGAADGAARALLWSTAAAGFVGMAFHAYGIQRNMGGWRNWSQNLLQGPPLPAPPSFTGMALAGLGALELIEGGTRG